MGRHETDRRLERVEQLSSGWETGLRVLSPCRGFSEMLPVALCPSEVLEINPWPGVSVVAAELEGEGPYVLGVRAPRPRSAVLALRARGNEPPVSLRTGQVSRFDLENTGTWDQNWFLYPLPNSPKKGPLYVWAMDNRKNMGGPGLILPKESFFLVAVFPIVDELRERARQTKIVPRHMSAFSVGADEAIKSYWQNFPPETTFLDRGCWPEYPAAAFMIRRKQSI